jgi:allantoin racemase
MRIGIVNPNTTQAFTASLQNTLRHVAAAGTELLVTNPVKGVASVESFAEEAVAALGVMAAVRQLEGEGADAYVVACFGDTGVQPAREIVSGPVVGMTEAALHAASVIADRFSIVTLPRRTLAHAERVVRHLGLSHRCTTYAIDVPVLALTDDDTGPVEAAIAEAAGHALAHDHAEAIILGCAGLSDMVVSLNATLGVPVIDGVIVALKAAEGLVAAGLKTSKKSSYALPPSRLDFSGWPSQEMRPEVKKVVF